MARFSGLKYEACSHILSKLSGSQRALREACKKRIAVIKATKDERRAKASSKIMREVVPDPGKGSYVKGCSRCRYKT